VVAGIAEQVQVRIVKGRHSQPVFGVRHLGVRPDQPAEVGVTSNG
jgi:hypothetical protein